jgi:hypothetical protein
MERQQVRRSIQTDTASREQVVLWMQNAKGLRLDGSQDPVGLTTACLELKLAVMSLSTSLISNGFIK